MTSVTLTEGIANLNAGVSVRRRGPGADGLERDHVGVGQDEGRGREVSYG